MVPVHLPPMAPMNRVEQIRALSIHSHRGPLRALARAELQRARGGAHACDAPAAVAQPTALRSIGEVTLDGPEVNATSSTTSTLNHNTQHGTTPPHCYRKHEGRGAPSGTMTGTVPATIGARSQPMMPVSTEVGQSGPPTFLDLDLDLGPALRYIW